MDRNIYENSLNMLQKLDKHWTHFYIHILSSLISYMNFTLCFFNSQFYFQFINVKSPIPHLPVLHTHTHLSLLPLSSSHIRPKFLIFVERHIFGVSLSIELLMNRLSHPVLEIEQNFSKLSYLLGFYIWSQT